MSFWKFRKRLNVLTWTVPYNWQSYYDKGIGKIAENVSSCRAEINSVKVNK